MKVKQRKYILTWETNDGPAADRLEAKMLGLANTVDGRLTRSDREAEVGSGYATETGRRTLRKLGEGVKRIKEVTR